MPAPTLKALCESIVRRRSLVRRGLFFDTAPALASAPPVAEARTAPPDEERDRLFVRSEFVCVKSIFTPP